MTRLYIGSDNETKKLDLPRIAYIAGRHTQGFTLMVGIGFWAGNMEDSAILEIDGVEASEKVALVNELKSELRQDAIGILELNTSMQYV